MNDGWWIITGLSAAAVSFAVNSFLYKRFGTKVLYFPGPLLEEALKTGLAVWAASSVGLSHVVFGGVEAIYEIQIRKNQPAGLSALAVHSFLGAMTVFLTYWGGFWPVAVLGAAIVHAAINYYLTRVIQRVE